jgi:quercetin dioxygenase-like cupin family protein
MSSAEVPDLASLPFVRRVVTGNDGQNKSEVLYDDTQGNNRQVFIYRMNILLNYKSEYFPVAQPCSSCHMFGVITLPANICCHRAQTLWFTDEVPADCSSETSKDPTGNQTFEISNEGSVRNWVFFIMQGNLILTAVINLTLSQVCMMVWIKPGSSSPMHQTKSIDYGVVLEGEIVLELDNGNERLLKVGYVIPQPIVRGYLVPCSPLCIQRCCRST